MPLNYIPTQDSLLRDWSQNFQVYLAANFTALGELVGTAGFVTASANNYQTKYLLAVNPNTRTRATVADKDAAKASMLINLRPVAQRINANFAVTDAQRAALGLTVRDRVPTRIPVPITQPILDVTFATPGTHNLRFADALTPAARKKPFGATQIQVYSTIDTNPALDPDAAIFRGAFTKNAIQLSYNAADNGKTATIWARWMNRKGQVGPWSAPATFTIAF